jgi:phosphoribosylglycinamide formyltransferase-1/phosphoribosylamine--glycine ligase/phosphoribosylglycinamide formyltransferase/phosphoribosylformylglycinamidine cyclo-ligase
MSPDPDADLERLRRIAMALPRAAEKISHGATAFYIEKGKIFAWFWHNHHNDCQTAVLVKTSGLEEQEMLIESDPDLYYRPAYVGPFGWVAIRTDQPHSDWDHIADRIRYSWELVALPKLRGAS